jgi:dephospho-CoA kinase
LALLVGLTGGIGAGKSTVADLFARAGARVISADQLARDVVAPASPAVAEIAEVFGAEFIAGGTLDRAKMAAHVFAEPEARKRLEAILHPRIRELFQSRAAAIASGDPAAVILYDAPVLIEAGAHAAMDRVVVVAADEETQVRRLATRDGMGREDALARIRAQMPLAEKLPHADHVLNGALPLERLTEHVRELMDEFAQSNSPGPAKRSATLVQSGGKPHARTGSRGKRHEEPESGAQKKPLGGDL